MKRSVNGLVRHVAGWKRDPHDPRDERLAVPILARLALPGAASLRSSPHIPRVEDQGQLGSCVYNSSTSALEFILKKDGNSLELSRLYGYARGRQFEGTGLDQDSGAHIRNAMKVLSNWGCCAEALWPYDLTKWNVDPPPAMDVDAAHRKLAFYYRCGTQSKTSLLAIRASIAQGYPVVGGFECPEAMFDPATANTGVVPYDADATYAGGHAVLFVGYDNERGLLQFQNSWGTRWGDHGYGYLPYEFVAKGLASDFWTMRHVVCS